MAKQLSILSFFLLFLTLSSQAKIHADTARIETHLRAITKTEKFRNYKNIDQLNKIADYIDSVFLQYADTVFMQQFTVNQDIYKNVICSFGTKNTKRIIVGAHYDVCGSQEGADDNASGVVGLLELARLLCDQELNYRIDLVAYTLEEPPFFKSQFMGSYVHAKSLADDNIDVYGMISLEMIGYFDEQKNSQDYPIGVLSYIYGAKGDYITLVTKFNAGPFADEFCRRFKSTNTLRAKIFVAPQFVEGVDFSDHLNYWKFGFSALMLTDTAFYRNKNYHKATDTMETLDLSRMGLVIDRLVQSLTSL